MSSNVYTVGLNNVGSYQVSGAPYATGSIDVTAAGAAGVQIQFPYVTSWIQIIQMNTDDLTDRNAPLFVALNQNALGTNNSFRVQVYEGGQGSPMSDVLPLKITELWLSGSGEATSGRQISAYVVAGLTNIPVQRITNISPSGSNWSGSVGVG